LHYQPQIDLKTGKTKSVEALIRWKHQTAGPIPPDVFIPLAEKSGHIHALTFWALDRALLQLKEWSYAGIEMNVAVNLSMYNLYDNNFPGLVAGLLGKWSIPARQLTLEITEGVVMHDPVKAIRTLAALRDLGTCLSLDDYGSGYSSLRYLGALPISELKLDRSLVMDIDINRKHAMIVRSTVELAKCLGLSVVAEGVEKKEVCGALSRFHCDMAQGFYFCKPVSGDELTSWLLNSNWGSPLCARRQSSPAADVSGCVRGACWRSGLSGFFRFAPSAVPSVK
jgi:EAL domain-containing protein (putative c-di-GMP-specific phosphodiesterase class I)